MGNRKKIAFLKVNKKSITYKVLTNITNNRKKV